VAVGKQHGKNAEHAVLCVLCSGPTLQTTKSWTPEDSQAAAACFPNLKTVTLKGCSISWPSLQPLLQQLPLVTSVACYQDKQGNADKSIMIETLTGLLTQPGLEEVKTYYSYWRGDRSRLELSDSLKVVRLEELCESTYPLIAGGAPM
jgi:hypothetical protein